MGSFSNLYTQNTDPRGRFKDKDELKKLNHSSKYHLPLLWLALFSENDVYMQKEEAIEEAEQWPLLIAEVDAVLSRLTSRSNYLTSAFGKDQILRPLTNLKVDISDAKQKFVILETSDIGSMVKAGEEWGDDVKLMVRAFEEPIPKLRQAWQKKIFGDGLKPGWRCYFHNFPWERYLIKGQFNDEYFVGN